MPVTALTIKPKNLKEVETLAAKLKQCKTEEEIKSTAAALCETSFELQKGIGRVSLARKGEKKSIKLGGKEAIVFIVEGSIIVAKATYDGPRTGWTVEGEPKIEICENTMIVIVIVK